MLNSEFNSNLKRYRLPDDGELHPRIKTTPETKMVLENVHHTPQQTYVSLREKIPKKDQDLMRTFDFPSPDKFKQGAINKMLKGSQEVDDKLMAITNHVNLYKLMKFSAGFTQYIKNDAMDEDTDQLPVRLVRIAKALILTDLMSHCVWTDSHLILREKLKNTKVGPTRLSIGECPSVAAFMLENFYDDLIPFIIESSQWKYNTFHMFTLICSKYIFTEHEFNDVESYMTSDDKHALGITLDRVIPTILTHGTEINTILFHLTGAGMSVNTTVQYFNFFKRSLEAEMGRSCPQLRSVIQVPRPTYLEHKQQASNRINKYQHRMLTFPSSDILALVKKLTESRDWLSKVLLLQLATGARFIEIIIFSDFYSMMDSSVYPKTVESTQNIIVSGFAKKREQNPTDTDQDAPENTPRKRPEAENVSKPVMFISPRQAIYLLYSEVRPHVMARLKETNTPSDDLRAVSVLFLSSANKLLRRMFSPHITTHWLRKIYANYSFDQVGSGLGLSKPAWITRVLGHTPETFTTALSYNNIQVCT